MSSDIKTTFISSMFDLSGRAAVVTGASGGLGKQMALVLAQAGASVLLVARRSERLAQIVDDNPELRDRLFPFSVDLFSPDAAQKIAQAAGERLKGADILVANAALGEYGGVTEFDQDVYDRSFLLNVTRQADIPCPSGKHA